MREAPSAERRTMKKVLKNCENENELERISFCSLKIVFYKFL